MWKTLPSLAVSLAVGIVLCVGALSLLGSIANARPMAAGPGLNSVAPIASRALQRAVDAVSGKSPASETTVRSSIDLVNRQLRATDIRSGGDFLSAAKIASKGTTPEDALLAHDLASCALTMGEREARTIIATSLDQYLVRTGRQQRFGTQKATPPDGSVTKGMRFIMGIESGRERQLGVPKIAAKADSTILNLVVTG